MALGNSITYNYSIYLDNKEMALMTNPLKVLDYTFLPDKFNPEMIESFIDNFVMNQHLVAAVCVWPQLVSKFTKYSRNIATVVNFPQGTDSLEKVIEDTKKALNDGATEIDLVYPYQFHKELSSPGFARYFLEKVRFLTVNSMLKVIIESGNLTTQEVIDCCKVCLDSNVDFIKTSTGKTKQGATISDAAMIMSCIGDKACGIKISGGVRDNETAQKYVDLWRLFNPKENPYEGNFRIGSSNILEVY
jgi:deoxyribose-phosphate aldolase